MEHALGYIADLLQSWQDNFIFIWLVRIIYGGMIISFLYILIRGFIEMFSNKGDLNWWWYWGGRNSDN